jgi:hypothetical protein
VSSDPLAFLHATLAAAQARAEAAAARAWSGDWEYDDMVGEIRDCNNAGTLAILFLPEIGRYIEDTDPASVLRRIAADRKILVACEEVLAVEGWEYDDAPTLEQSTIRSMAEGWGWTGEV